MCLNVKWIKNPVTGQRITVPCGRCLECLNRQASEWALRIDQEARYHSVNSFITLTYNESHVPDLGHLKRSDLQNFIKRLRKKIYPQKIRVFYCGEYGSKKLRPHYHVIVFGWAPPDLRFFKFDGNIPLYRSSLVEKLWSRYYLDDSFNPAFDPMGFVTVGAVTHDSAKYCAKYLQKLRPLPLGHPPPFIGMSNRRGIGYQAIRPEMILQSGIYFGGRRFSVPRYYVKVLEEGHDLEEYKLQCSRVAQHYQWISFVQNAQILRERRKKAEKVLTALKIRGTLE